jgi:5'-nucleotidase (lipoprotein e(P4) family)
MNTLNLVRALLLVMIASLGACATKSLSSQPSPSQANQGIIWVNSAAEYQALSLQVYESATRHLDRLIADENWTALPGLQARPELPTAIILDVDETSISNVNFQLQLEGSFSHEAFDKWHQTNPAGRMPGAPKFIQSARDKGVEVFFITNRPCHERDFAPGPCPQKAITLQDLAEAGIETDTDHLMLVDEQEGWTREKRFRQYHVAETHRVIMLFGDDLGDFLPCVRAKPVAPCTAATAKDRSRMTRQHKEYWGFGWYMLPNPMHGSWTSFISNE